MTNNLLLFAGKFIVVVVFGLILSGAVILWRLSIAPISLGFLTPYLEAALSSDFDGFTTQLQDTVIKWGPVKQALDLQLLQVKISDQSGNTIASIPEVSFSIQMLSLLEGEVLPSKLSDKFTRSGQN